MKTKLLDEFKDKNDDEKRLDVFYADSAFNLFNYCTKTDSIKYFHKIIPRRVIIKAKRQNLCHIVDRRFDSNLSHLQQLRVLYIHLWIVISNTKYAIFPHRVSLIVGIITFIAGLTGVLAGAEISKRQKVHYSNAEALVCAYGILFGSPLLFGTLFLADKSVNASWVSFWFVSGWQSHYQLTSYRILCSDSVVS